MGPSAVRTAGIDHLHLNVYDLTAAIELFTGLFQCQHNIPLYIDSVDGTNSMNSLGIDVIAPASEDGFYARMMKKAGGQGMSAAAFYVEDLDQATRHVASTGLRVISEIGFPEIERQTQFHPKDLFGMSLELAYLYPDAKQKMIALREKQAEQEGTTPTIPPQPGAVPSAGIHHVRLRVPSVEALDIAIQRFESAFECDWERMENGRAATSSLDVHLLVSDDGSQGIDGFGMAVPDLEQAVARAVEIGLRPVGPPDYLGDREKAMSLSPEDCFGLHLVLVENDEEREHRHH